MGTTNGDSSNADVKDGWFGGCPANWGAGTSPRRGVAANGSQPLRRRTPIRYPLHHDQRIERQCTLPLGEDHQRIDVDLGDPGMGEHERGEARDDGRGGIDVAGGRTAERTKQSRALEQAQFGCDLGLRQVGRQQANVAKRFRLHSAKPYRKHRPPSGIVAHAQDQFEATFGRHPLDQDAVEAKVGCCSCNIGINRLPPGFERQRVAQTQDHTARIALVRQVGCLRLERDGVADFVRDGARVVEGAGETPLGNCNAGRRQMRLGEVLGDDAARQFLARRGDGCRTMRLSTRQADPLPCDGGERADHAVGRADERNAALAERRDHVGCDRRVLAQHREHDGLGRGDLLQRLQDRRRLAVRECRARHDHPDDETAIARIVGERRQRLGVELRIDEGLRGQIDRIGRQDEPRRE